MASEYSLLHFDISKVVSLLLLAGEYRSAAAREPEVLNVVLRRGVSSERVFSRLAAGPCGWEAVAECSEGLREGLVRGWAALGVSASSVRPLNEEKRRSSSPFPLRRPRCRWISAILLASGSRALMVGLVRGWAASEAPTRSSLDEEERTYSFLPFFLLTA